MNETPSSSILCLYHDDADGRACAAIIRRKLGSDVFLKPMNYGQPTPWALIDQADRVIIADFSLPLDKMKSISSEHHLVWIDHHQSALQDLGSVADHWDGIRDTSEAACVLTWKYYYPEKDLPRAVILIGDRDIWRWEEQDTGPFNEGLHHRDTDPHLDELWSPLLNDDSSLVEKIIQEGALLFQARLKEIKRAVNAYGYEVDFEGHRTLAINRRGTGDLGARIRELGYELAYCYLDIWEQGQLVTKVTLYSETLDVSQLAKRYGGGGHPGASGFQFSRREIPFPPGADIKFNPGKK